MWWYNQCTHSITHTYPKTKLVYINCTTDIQHVQVVITATLVTTAWWGRDMGWTSMDKHKKACAWDKYGNWEWSAQNRSYLAKPPLARIRPQHHYIHVVLFSQPQHGQQNQWVRMGCSCDSLSPPLPNDSTMITLPEHIMSILWTSLAQLVLDEAHDT